MAAYNRGPDPINSTFFIPGSATPGNGVKVFTYSNLSSTKVTVYKDTSGTQHTNPIILDSGGNLPGGSQVYIAAGQTLTVKYAPAIDSDPPLSPYLTINDVVGINDVSTAVSEWTLGPAPTFVSATQFTLAGDQTANFEKGRFVKSSNTGGTAYSKIINSVYGVLTTVTVVNISGVIDSGISAVSYGADAVNPAFGADHVNRKATAVASAVSGTTGIWDTNGDYVHVTGVNTINSFSSAPYAGAQRMVVFDGALSINTSASLSIPGGNVTTSAGDTAIVRADTTANALITFYQSITGRGSPPTVTTLTTTGTYNRPAGVSAVLVELVGGGGGSGGSASTAAGNIAASGGGGGGGYSMTILRAAQIGTSTPYTIGAGGLAGGFGNVNGSTGGTTFFAGTSAALSLILATGGLGGSGGTLASSPLASAGGAGGMGSTGIFNIQGSPGGYGISLPTNVQGAGGHGGSSVFGGGGVTAPSITTTTGAIGGLYGGGASGSIVGQAQTSTTGMPGGQGAIRLVEFY